MALSDQADRFRVPKRIIQSAVHRFGLHVGRFPPVDSLAYHLKTLFREMLIDCVLDVGAHTGEYGCFLRELGYRGAIISFEPVKDSYLVLTDTCAHDGKWLAENAAVGPEDGEMEINICAGSVFNSFLQPTTTEVVPNRFRDDLRVVRTEKVRVRPLSAVIDERLAAHPDARIFVKTDTQGFDLQALRSAGHRLDCIMATQTELAVRPMYAGMPTLPQGLVELERLGFEVTGMFPVAREMDHLRVIEFDCVTCRSPREAAFRRQRARLPGEERHRERTLGR